MVSKNTIFKYKTVNGPLHKWPAMLKLFLLFPLSIICMSLPSLWLLKSGIIIAIIAAFLCRFTLREQLTDLKPAIIYAILMYSISVFSNMNEYLNNIESYSMISVLLPRSEFLRIALRLILIVQISALFFRTTSSLELRECLNFIERFIRRFIARIPFFGKHVSHNPLFAQNIALFLSFIPEIFAIWTSVNLTWKARGGKKGFNKIRVIVFVLISIAFEKAALKAKALEARSKNYD